MNGNPPAGPVRSSVRYSHAGTGAQPWHTFDVAITVLRRLESGFAAREV